ncbi:hypothetical protein BaRGS_00039628 [Batillaria attramentaria]|uniref:G-protein coupled receptors family 1 profile domain-containing protein n=1 Tax=Batillaria attramentaria TaxID=370345 RepID=A0ABD0J2N0_9CAEN
MTQTNEESQFFSTPEQPSTGSRAQNHGLATTDENSWATAVPTSVNATEICVMCKYYISPGTKALSLQMTLRYCLINLTITDMLYGFGFAYHSAVVDIDGMFKKNTAECKARYSILSMLSIVTLFTVMTMSAERVIALQFPYKHAHWVKKSSILCVIAVDWIIPAVITAVPYGTMNPAIKVVMFAIARVHIKKIVPNMVGDDKRTVSLKLNDKATMTTLCVALPFIVCATPKVLTYLYLADNPEERLKLHSVTMLAVTFYINVTNSFLNPIIYCWRVTEIRQQVKVMLRCGSTGRRADVNGQSTSRS